MTPEDRIARAIRDAQIVLAAYLQPGPQNPEQTINELFNVLDDYPLIEALKEIESRAIEAPATAPEHADQEGTSVG